MVGTEPRPLRLAELLASVSLATDLGTGQPPGHAPRTCTVAGALAEALDCGPEDIRTVQQLYISPKTVGRHVEYVYGKIGVSSRAAAAVFAMEHRLLE